MTRTPTQKKLDKLFGQVRETKGDKKYLGAFEKEPSAYFYVNKESMYPSLSIVFSTYQWLLRNCEYKESLTNKAKQALQDQWSPQDLLHLCSDFLQIDPKNRFEPSEGGNELLPRASHQLDTPNDMVEPSVPFAFVLFDGYGEYAFNKETHEPQHYIAIQLLVQDDYSGRGMEDIGDIAIFSIAEEAYMELLSVDIYPQEKDRSSSYHWSNYNSNKFEYISDSYEKKGLAFDEYGVYAFSVNSAEDTTRAKEALRDNWVYVDANDKVHCPLTGRILTVCAFTND